jgi:hypothetical protein
MVATIGPKLGMKLRMTVRTAKKMGMCTLLQRVKVHIDGS